MKQITYPKYLSTAQFALLAGVAPHTVQKSNGRFLGVQGCKASPRSHWRWAADEVYSATGRPPIVGWWYGEPLSGAALERRKENLARCRGAYVAPYDEPPHKVFIRDESVDVWPYQRFFSEHGLPFCDPTLQKLAGLQLSQTEDMRRDPEHTGEDVSLLFMLIRAQLARFCSVMARMDERDLRVVELLFKGISEQLREVLASIPKPSGQTGDAA